MVDITINETIDVVDITVNPNIIEVNVTRTSGDGGSQTLAQTLDNGNQTGGENILVNNADAIELENSSKLSQGIVDAGTGGNKGIALTCAVGFEWKFEAGEAYLTETNSEYIRLKQYARSLPSVNDDISKGFVNGSFWYLDSGIAYVCTDSPNGAAVWEIYHNFIPTLQQVVNEDNLLTDTAIAFDSVGNPNLTSAVSINGLSFVENDGIDEETTVYASNGIQRNLNANGTLLNFETPTNSDNVVLVPNGSGTLAFTSDIPTTTSQLTNDGADGVNPFITALDIPTTGQASTLVREVKNMTGATLTKGTVVYISGANGNKALVSKAIATTDALSARTFGLLQSNISNNGLGNCVIIGDLSGINTSSFAEGAQLYLSGTVAGAFTDTRVLAPTHLVYVGKVTRSHPTQGQIEVQIQNGYELAEIHDVQIVTPLNNQGLVYETSSQLWKNKTIIEDIITDGVTTVAPSQNAVFDALALKQNNLKTFNTTQGIYFFDDFMGSLSANFTNTPNGIITSIGNGQGTLRTTSTINNRTNQQGVVEALTNANATGTAGYFYSGGVYKGSGAITIETYINFTTLSVLGERFFSLFGFYTGANFTNPPNAIMIVYDEGGAVIPNAASTFFRCVTRIGGATITNNVTSIPVVAAQWYRLKINISNDGNTVTFFIDNTLVATHTTNIPLNATFLPVGCMLQKTSGTAARAMQTDYFMYEEIFTNPR
jgi:hypothetical protein